MIDFFTSFFIVCYAHIKHLSIFLSRLTYDLLLFIWTKFNKCSSVNSPICCFQSTMSKFFPFKLIGKNMDFITTIPPVSLVEHHSNLWQCVLGFFFFWYFICNLLSFTFEKSKETTLYCCWLCITISDHSLIKI